MKQGEKQLYRKFQEWAMAMPVNYTTHKEIKSYTGAEILKENPQAKDGSGNPIVSEKQYTIKVDAFTGTVDHFKRMKRLYRKKGLDAVKQYVNGVMDLELEAAAPKTIGGIATVYE